MTSKRAQEDLDRQNAQTASHQQQASAAVTAAQDAKQRALDAAEAASAATSHGWQDSPVDAHDSYGAVAPHPVTPGA